MIRGQSSVAGSALLGPSAAPPAALVEAAGADSPSKLKVEETGGSGLRVLQFRRVPRDSDAKLAENNRR